MTTESEAAVAALLQETESAHGTYEAGELGGVFDTAWATWYARFLLEHGLADRLPGAGSLGVDGLATMLTLLAADYERGQPTDSWQDVYARRMAAALG